MPEYISIPAFAERAGVSRQAVHKRVDRDLQPFVKLTDGKKLIDTNALMLFARKEVAQPIDGKGATNEQPTSTVAQPTSTDAADKLAQVLQEQIATLAADIKEERAENRRLTEQLITLSNDFSQLARQSNTLLSQQQSLQGHMQQQTLGNGTGVVDATESDVDTTVDVPRGNWFTRIFK